MIFSASLNLLVPNLVWWCFIMSQIVFQKDWFAVFKVTVKSNIIKIWLCNILSELLILLQLNLVWWHIIIGWIVLWKDWIALLWSRSRSQKRFRIPVNVHLNDISSAAEPSVTKLAMVMQHHGPKYARRLVSCLQVQGHSGGSFDQIWLFLSYLLNCWSFCSQIWMVHYHKLKNKIVVFKVKITVTVQNFIESLCILYLLYHWSLGNQRRCAYLLFIITNQAQQSWHILTVALWLTLSLGTLWGLGVFCHARWQTVCCCLLTLCVFWSFLRKLVVTLFLFLFFSFR